MKLIETCKTDASISIGGATEGNSFLSLSQAELGAISAASLSLISSQGAISAKALAQSIHFGHLIGDVTMNAATTITFSEATSWEGLTAKATSGMIISADLSSTTRSLHLSLSTGNFIATSTNPKTISSETDIQIISDSGTSKLAIQSPAMIISKMGSEIGIAIDVTRNPSGDATFVIYSDAALSCAKPVQFIGNMNGVNKMHIEVASITSSETCYFSADDHTDKINVLPSCTGANCRMDFGTFLDAATWTVPNLELFTSGGELTIGDTEFSQRVAKIRINGTAYSSGNKGVTIRALHNNGQILFLGGHSEFENELSLYSSTIIVGATVIVNALTTITIRGCSNKDLQLISNGAIRTDGSTINLKAGFLDISSDAFQIESPYGSINFESICVGSSGNSLALGGNFHESWTTTLDKTELRKISATILKIYTTGNAELFGFETSDLPGVAHLRLNIQTVGKFATFSADTEAKQLTLQADGIIISNKAIISTTIGDLSMSFSSGNMTMDGRLETKAMGILIQGSGHLFAFNDASLKAKTTINLQVQMSVSRKADTEFHVYSEGMATFEEKILFSGAFDNTRFRLEVMDLALNGAAAIQMDRASDTLLIQRPCTTEQSCKMYFGDYTSTGDFHMTLTELKLLSTAGAIVLGDFHEEGFISTIYLNDVDLSLNDIGSLGITIAARKSKIGRAIFETKTSKFMNVVHLVGSSGIIFNKDVFFTQLGILHSEDDCIMNDMWNKEGLKMTGAGKIIGYVGLTINLAEVTVSQTAVIEAKTPGSAYKHIDFIESCWRQDSIKLGNAESDTIDKVLYVCKLKKKRTTILP
jgi:hypothetical protein